MNFPKHLNLIGVMEKFRISHLIEFRDICLHLHTIDKTLWRIVH